MKFADKFWLAGLLEGEGSFDVQTRKKERRHDRPRIQLAMTDLDIMERVCRLLNSRLNGPYGAYGRQLNKKPIYKTMVRGTRAVELMSMLYPLLGVRRKLQILTALKRTHHAHSSFRH